MLNCFEFCSGKAFEVYNNRVSALACCFWGCTPLLATLRLLRVPLLVTLSLLGVHVTIGHIELLHSRINGRRVCVLCMVYLIQKWE